MKSRKVARVFKEIVSAALDAADTTPVLFSDDLEETDDFSAIIITVERAGVELYNEADYYYSTEEFNVSVDFQSVVVNTDSEDVYDKIELVEKALLKADSTGITALNSFAFFHILPPTESGEQNDNRRNRTLEFRVIAELTK